MTLCVLFCAHALAWTTLPAHRLIQFHTNSSNTTLFGSSKVAMDHEIGKFGEKPNQKRAVFVPIEKATVENVSPYIEAGSPVIFLMDGKTNVNITELENFLIGGNQKAPVYFVYESAKVPTGFTHVKTADVKSNSAVKKTRLQNVIGTLNVSGTHDRERIAVISAPLDTFATVPSAEIGANNNGLALAAFLEVMRLVSKFSLANNWVFVFAVTDGHFCDFEGLEREMNALAGGHAGKIEFGLSIESIAAPHLSGLFGQRIKRESAFAKFVMCLIDSMKAAGVPLETELSEEKRTQGVFSKHLVQSIAIMNSDNDEISRVGDSTPNIERANAVAWAVAEALLRMVYDADNTATMIERQTVDSSYWANIIGKIPRMSAFRDQTAASILAQWMRKFTTVSVDEWASRKCLAPFSATDANLVLYNPTPVTTSVALFFVAILYGFVVFLAIAGVEGVKKFFK